MPWISVKDARARVDNAVSLQTIYRLVHSGLVRGLQIKGKILVDDEDLARYLKRAGFRVIQSSRLEDSHAAALDTINSKNGARGAQGKSTADEQPRGRHTR